MELLSPDPIIEGSGARNKLGSWYLTPERELTGAFSKPCGVDGPELQDRYYSMCDQE
jgi:hypothetical protein